MVDQSSILVTGHNGFIGSHLTKRLLELGHRVVGVDNFRAGPTEDWYYRDHKNNFSFFSCDFAYKTVLESIQKNDYDYVFHLAATSAIPTTIKDIVSSNENNVSKSVQLLEACSNSTRVKRFVFSSSSGIYQSESRRNVRMHETVSTNCASTPYAIQKHTVENYCRYYSKLKNLDTVSLRYFNVFGTHQRSESNLVSGWLKKLKDGKPLPIYGTDKSTRDYVHVSNVVDANIAAMEYISPLSGLCLNVGSGKQYSLEDVKNIFLKEFPMAEFEYQPERTGDASNTLACTFTLKQVLGIDSKTFNKFEDDLSDVLKECKETIK